MLRAIYALGQRAAVKGWVAQVGGSRSLQGAEDVTNLLPTSGDGHAIQGHHQMVNLVSSRVGNKVKLVEIVSERDKEARRGQG